MTKKDVYLLPLMNGTLDKLRKARYISKIDSGKGFLQIPLQQEIRQKTALIVSGRGLIQLKKMPLGLTYAPATLQRLLNRLIDPEMEPHCLAYLNDIIIVTEYFEEHFKWLSKVFTKLRKAGLTINPNKCEFRTSESSIWAIL